MPLGEAPEPSKTPKKLVGDLALLASAASSCASIAALIGGIVTDSSYLLVLGVLILGLPTYLLLNGRRQLVLLRKRNLELEASNERLLISQRSLQTDLPIYEDNTSEIILDQTQSYYEISTKKVVRNENPVSIEFFMQTFICNKHPSDPEASLSYYLQRPIRWSDLKVWAKDKDGNLDVRLMSDFNNRKDFMIRLEEGEVPRHIGPGATREISYGYTVPRILWGNYFDRPVRKPTNRLSVAVTLPRSLSNITVGIWSLSATSPKQALPHIACEESDHGMNRTYRYNIPNPLLGHSYQIMWRYYGQDVDDSTDQAVVPEAPTG